MSPFDLGLEGKVALVTGSSGGIGYSTAELLAQVGVKVFLVSRDETQLTYAASKIRQFGGVCDGMVGDVLDIGLPLRAVEKIAGLWGEVDILVNNAGGPPIGTFLEFGYDAWSRALDTNLLASVRFTQAVTPSMRERNWGRIISISSSVAKEPSPEMVLSATARAGLSAFTKAVSIELASKNITVNVICPGGVKTDRLKTLFQSKAERESLNYSDLLRAVEESIPIQRFADPSEIAGVALFLASKYGSYITGVSLTVDGGLTKGF